MNGNSVRVVAEAILEAVSGLGDDSRVPDAFARLESLRIELTPGSDGTQHANVTPLVMGAVLACLALTPDGLNDRNASAVRERLDRLQPYAAPGEAKAEAPAADAHRDHSEPRAVVMNILDRASFTDVPFWDTEADERERLTDLLGIPTVLNGGSLWLALAVLNEVAVELLTNGTHPAEDRLEAIGLIRARVAEVFADD